MASNPFSLMYGRIPASFIQRTDEFRTITNTFKRDFPNTLAYIVTGIRGSGKTVLLRAIAKELEKTSDFIVVDLNAQEEMISSFSQKLFYEGNKTKLFPEIELTVDLRFIQLRIGKSELIQNPEVIGERLLQSLCKKGKKVLVTIDEVNNTQDMRKFANFYQSMVGKDLNVFLLMTGLKKNIDVLVESKAASFLSRTPKIELRPLDLADVAREYAKVFSIDDSIAFPLAKLTKGYALAYQVLGYFFFESPAREIDEALLEKYDEYLRKNGYDIIWNELTQKEKELCVALYRSPDAASSALMRLSGMSESNFQNYRARLIEKGVLEPNGYGKLAFALPRFERFIKAYMVYFI